MQLQAILADFGRHWPVYVSMPFIAAAIGYVTKRVAIEMMFRPVEFVGIKGTIIGWRGVLPHNAARMAAIATELLTNNLIDMREIFARLDPERVAREVQGPLLRVVEDLTEEIIEQYQPGLWDRLPEAARALLLRQIRAEAPRLVKRIMADISADINSVLDVNDMAITHLVQDKELLNRLIRDIAQPELNFIANCGIVFGFLLGVIQTVVWALTHAPLVMPLFGLGVGWFTDWLALKMIFFPREPRRFFGLVTWQGIFQKRRAEVARDYAKVVATEVLSTKRILTAILRGPRSDRLFALIQREVEQAIDDQFRVARPLVTLTVGTRRFQQVKLVAVAKSIEKLPDTLAYIEDYVTEALDIRNTIVDRMARLSPLEFEMLLRPAFRQEEWKLIAVGALIGFLVGEIQVFAFLH